MSKTYLLFPKVLKGEKADLYFKKTKKNLGHNIDLSPTFDGITRKEVLYNGSDDNERIYEKITTII